MLPSMPSGSPSPSDAASSATVAAPVKAISTSVSMVPRRVTRREKRSSVIGVSSPRVPSASGDPGPSRPHPVRAPKPAAFERKRVAEIDEQSGTWCGCQCSTYRHGELRHAHACDRTRSLISTSASCVTGVRLECSPVKTMESNVCVPSGVERLIAVDTDRPSRWDQTTPPST